MSEESERPQLRSVHDSRLHPYGRKGLSCELAHHLPSHLIHRMRCTACRTAFDRCHHPAESQSLFAVARLECLLRAALAGNRIVNLGVRYHSGQSLLLFVEDVAWALMLPVVGTRYRVLHALQTTEFRVPMGFNTPVSADHWLSCGPLEIRRSILAVLASLISDIQTCCTLMSCCSRGRTFWKAMKLLHCSEDRQAFKYRAASWSFDLIDAADFYQYEISSTSYGSGFLLVNGMVDGKKAVFD